VQKTLRVTPQKCCKIREFVERSGAEISFGLEVNGLEA